MAATTIPKPDYRRRNSRGLLTVTETPMILASATSRFDVSPGDRPRRRRPAGLGAQCRYQELAPGRALASEAGAQPRVGEQQQSTHSGHPAHEMASCEAVVGRCGRRRCISQAFCDTGLAARPRASRREPWCRGLQAIQVQIGSGIKVIATRELDSKTVFAGVVQKARVYGCGVKLAASPGRRLISCRFQSDQTATSQ